MSPIDTPTHKENFSDAQIAQKAHLAHPDDFASFCLVFDAFVQGVIGIKYWIGRGAGLLEKQFAGRKTQYAGPRRVRPRQRDETSAAHPALAGACVLPDSPFPIGSLAHNQISTPFASQRLRRTAFQNRD